MLTCTRRSLVQSDFNTRGTRHRKFSYNPVISALVIPRSNRKRSRYLPPLIQNAKVRSIRQVGLHPHRVISRPLSP